MPTSQNLDEHQGTSIPDVNEIDSLILPASDSDHNPKGVCIPCSNGSEESGPAASNPGSFQPATLELEEGELDTRIYIPAL
jgi:hypothetical protein